MKEVDDNRSDLQTFVLTALGLMLVLQGAEYYENFFKNSKYHRTIVRLTGHYFQTIQLMLF